MNNCLVTKLKGVVNNDNLNVLGFGRIKADEIPSGNLSITVLGEITWDTTLNVYSNAERTQQLTPPLNYAESTLVPLWISGNGSIRSSKYSTNSLKNVEAKCLLSYTPYGNVFYIEGLTGELSDVAEILKSNNNLRSLISRRYKDANNQYVDLHGDLSVFDGIVNESLINIRFMYASDYSGCRITGSLTNLSGFFNLQELYIQMIPALANQDIKPLLDQMVANGRESGTFAIYATGVGVIYENVTYTNARVAFSNGAYTVQEIV